MLIQAKGRSHWLQVEDEGDDYAGARRSRCIQLHERSSIRHSVDTAAANSPSFGQGSSSALLDFHVKVIEAV